MVSCTHALLSLGCNKTLVSYSGLLPWALINYIQVVMRKNYGTQWTQMTHPSCWCHPSLNSFKKRLWSCCFITSWSWHASHLILLFRSSQYMILKYISLPIYSSWCTDWGYEWRRICCWVGGRRCEDRIHRWEGRRNCWLCRVR